MVRTSSAQTAIGPAMPCLTALLQALGKRPRVEAPVFADSQQAQSAVLLERFEVSKGACLAALPSD